MTPSKLRRLWHREQLGLLAMGLAVGLLGGYGAVGFRWLISILRKLAYGQGDDFLVLLAGHTWWYRILIPCLGGLLVGPLIYFLAREAKGHGVPEVMEAVTLKDGLIRKRVVAVKSLASALSIAVGGSVGREGPIVQICSAIGSSLGQVFKASPNRMRILVGCGAAAGIAATFNAPLAGMMFALEIILGEFAITTFSPIVLSAVVATAISRFYLGDFPAFVVPQYELVSLWEFPLYGLLAIIAGVVAVSFTTILYKCEDLLDGWAIPEYLKAGAVGIWLGAAGIFMPTVLGVGYEGIELALSNHMIWWLLLIALVVKILATSLTIAGGMSGGIFAPSLFMGAMLGAAFGQAANYFFPDITAGPGAYTIVAMAALVAGTTHGPMSAFLILFEMTGGYKIILPLMISCVAATLVARALRPESIYTLKLLRRGIDIRAGKEMNLLRRLKVSQAMRRQVESVGRGTTLGDFHRLVTRSKLATFPVVDENGLLVGILGHRDYADHFQNRDLWDLVVVGEMATGKVLTVNPGDSLEKALEIISARDFATLPVVASKDNPRLVGIISHRDIISLYSRELRKQNL